MSDIVGKKAKSIEIPVPVGKKIKGRITEVKKSQKFEGYLDFTIEFLEFKKWSDDGSRQFVKRAYYGIPVDWSPNNKAGKFYRSLEGKFPEQEGVNWTKLLLDREVECIFEDAFDKETGDPKGQRITWVGGCSRTAEGVVEKQDEELIF